MADAPSPGATWLVIPFMFVFGSSLLPIGSPMAITWSAVNALIKPGLSPDLVRAV